MVCCNDNLITAYKLNAINGDPCSGGCIFRIQQRKDTIFLKPLLELLDLSFYPQKFRRKQAFTPGNSAKLCDNPRKFQDQKSRPIEIPHYFFLNTPGNSTSFLIDPWNFHVLFLKYPWKFHVLNPLCLDFFWNSPFDKNPITQVAINLLRVAYSEIKSKS